MEVWIVAQVGKLKYSERQHYIEPIDPMWILAWPKDNPPHWSAVEAIGPTRSSALVSLYETMTKPGTEIIRGGPRPPQCVRDAAIAIMRSEDAHA